MRRLRRVIRKWLHDRRRRYMAQRRGVYECVGGPRDGERLKWLSGVSWYCDRGVYRHDVDWRLHYHADAHVPSWQGDE
jgi:hypothetical protein